MKRINVSMIGTLLMLCGLVLPAAGQTSTTTTNNPTFFGKVFSFVKTDSSTKSVEREQPPIPPNMNVDRSTVIEKDTTVTTAFKSFKPKDSAPVNGIEPNMIHVDFVDGNNVTHNLDIPPNMIKSVVLDSNNTVRFIEIEPNMVKAGAVEGGAAFGIPPNMMIPPNMIEGEQH